MRKILKFLVLKLNFQHEGKSLPGKQDCSGLPPSWDPLMLNLLLKSKSEPNAASMECPQYLQKNLYPCTKERHNALKFCLHWDSSTTISKVVKPTTDPTASVLVINIWRHYLLYQDLWQYLKATWAFPQCPRCGMSAASPEGADSQVLPPSLLCSLV
jgi:hypothetical protein